jgi:hypothetical protein
MKHWADPNQKPVVRPVLFQEVGGAPRAPSPFFEGRTPASYTGHAAANPVAPEAPHDPFAGFADDGAIDAYGSGDDESAFNPIVPAESLGLETSGAFLGSHAPPLEPHEDPRVHDAIASLGASAEALIAARSGALAAAEHDVIRLAVALAQRIVGAEIRQRPEVLLAAAREGISVLSESDRYVVRIASGPSEEHIEALRGQLVAKHPRSEVIVDPRLAPFTCIVESEHGRVDESIGARMAAVLEQAGLTKVAGGA